MSHALVCMSHSPLLEHGEPPEEVRAAVGEAFARARGFVEEFDPELIVTFGPDHYNGFFYDLLPPFCLGLAAHGTGDYDSFAGALDVPGDLAFDLARSVMESGVDLAVSRAMEVDHGAVQPLEILYDGDAAARPVLPFFVNAVGRPYAPVSRIRALGEAVGRYFRDTDKRVLFLGSGGLSHDPPVPRYETATEEQRRFLIDGRNPTAAARAARQQRVIDTAKAFAAGEADIMDLNPEWDRAFMEVCASGEVERFDGYDADTMDAVAGHSSHEVRTWVAAYSALRACGEYDVTYSFYRPIREYIAGFAVTTALPTAR